MGDIVSRIQQIEQRIQDIQNMGNIKRPQTDPKPTDKPQNEKFSDVLQEVMKSRAASELSLLGETSTDGSSNILEELNNVGNIKNTLLENKIDSLIDTYKKTGVMPTATPKPLYNNMITSTNPGTWDSIISKASHVHNVDEKLIHAVIQTESAYNPEAVSRVGAEGLMQLMPYTAEELGVNNPFDPEQNIMGGAKYLRQMLDRYNGDIIKSLAAYNAGPEAVDNANGIPNYKETKEYVPKVLNYYYNMNQ